MHEFYNRMQSVFERAGSNRSQFCKKCGFSYQTLQSYWNSDKLPPGNVLEALAREFHVSLDALVLGREPPETRAENPVLARLTQLLRRQDYESLLRIEGALRMFDYLGAGTESPERSAGRQAPPEPPDMDLAPRKMEKVSELLTRLAQSIQAGVMSAQDKDLARELLNQIVRNIYVREETEEWATLEEID